MTLHELRLKHRKERAELFRDAAQRANTPAEAAAILNVPIPTFAAGLKNSTGKTFNELKGIPKGKSLTPEQRHKWAEEMRDGF